MRGGEVGKADLVLVEVVEARQLDQQLLRRLGYGFCSVHLGGGGAANPPPRHAFKSSLTRTTGSRPLSISATIALPTTAASAWPRRAFRCSGREMPNPAATGRLVWLRTFII